MFQCRPWQLLTSCLKPVCLVRFKTTWTRKDVITTKDLTKAEMDIVFAEANHIKQLTPEQQLGTCRGRVLGALFFEPSTRTSSSFKAAFSKLGGTYIHVNEADSSRQKGESLLDTIRVMENYCDVIVVRHPEDGSAKIAAEGSYKPVVNAGDGGNEHPTQALMDIYTMVEHCKGDLKERQVTLVGDLLYGRTVHSIAPLLRHFPGLTINYVAPDALQIPSTVTEAVGKQVKQEKHSKLSAELLGKSDVVYMTRIQKERFKDISDYNKLKGVFVIGKDEMKLLKKDGILMHPLPRVDEITTDCDKDPRSIYFNKQLQNGLLVRQAILKILTDNIKK